MLHKEKNSVKEEDSTKNKKEKSEDKGNKKSKRKKVLAVVYDVIFVVVLLVLIEICITVYRGKAPSALGFTALRVISSSMEPLLYVDDCVLVKRTKPEEIKIGDVITYHTVDPLFDGFLNTHRVVGIEKDENGKYRYTTKGDSNALADYYPAYEENLVGRYYCHLPFDNVISFIFRKLSNRNIYFVVIMLPVMFCFVQSVVALILAIIELFSGDKDNNDDHKNDDSSNENTDEVRSL